LLARHLEKKEELANADASNTWHFFMFGPF
jgi:hypothetical protein